MPQRSTWRTSMSPRSMRLQPQGSPQQVPPMQGKLQRSWPKRDDRPGCRKNRKNRNGWRRKSRTGWRKRN
uniref:MAP7 domain containing 2 n=1 Tax=Rousettus aegyptiacus TaxID=9407 RepID=A0A7J8EKM3_ROUAE|nr:MAP7 domain containing 2 [Rousettus aegyptiacus]